MLCVHLAVVYFSTGKVSKLQLLKSIPLAWQLWQSAGLGQQPEQPAGGPAWCCPAGPEPVGLEGHESPPAPAPLPSPGPLLPFELLLLPLPSPACITTYMTSCAVTCCCRQHSTVQQRVCLSQACRDIDKLALAV